MRKFSKFITVFIAFFSVCILSFNVAYADDTSFVSEDGVFEYTLKDGYAYLNKCNCNDGDIVIPDCFNGCPVISIESKAFYCKDITSVFIPSSVCEIHDSAFALCRNISNVVLPAGLHTLDIYSFYGCSDLRNVNLNDLTNLKEINSYAFDGCPLENIDLSNFTKINDYGFHNNESKYITIPSNIIFIGENAFSSRTTHVLHVEGELPKLSSDCFVLNDSTSKIYVDNEESYSSLYNNRSDYCRDSQEIRIKNGTTRIAGEDRYETACKIALESYDTSDGVIIATGENYPDALSVAGLAGVYDYPILLNPSDSLRDDVEATIKQLNAKYAVIVGGENVISDNVANDLTSLCETYRISGEDRYDTSKAIYNANNREWGNTAIIASGSNYPDALSISAYAFSNDYPIFLAESSSSSFSDGIQDIILNGSFTKIIIVGGENAINKDLENIVSTGPAEVERWFGNDRYETSKEINEKVCESGSYQDCTCAATGDNYPDALAGSVLAGKNNSLIALVNNASNENLLKNHIGLTCNVYVLGGLNAVSDISNERIVAEFSL